MRRVNHLWIERNHLVPRLLVLLQILNPDNDAPDAGKTVHGRIPTEEDSVFHHGDMVGSVAGRFDNLERQRERLELLRVDGDKPVNVLLFDWRKFVFAFPEELQDLTEQPRQTAGASANKRILTLEQSLNSHRVKNHLGIRDGQHVIQESGMVIVGMGQKYILDFFGCDASLFQLFRETLEAVGISCVDQDISALIHTDEVIVGDPIAEVIDHCYLELNVPSGCSTCHCLSISDPGRV